MVEKFDGDFFRWIVGGLLSFIIGLSMLWLSRVQAQLDDLIPRLSAVEVKEATIAARLDRLEQKIDLLREELRQQGVGHVR